MLPILTVLVVLVAAMVLPVAAVRGVIHMHRNKDRHGTMSGGVAGLMMELDRVVRPSVQYIIEAKDSVFHEDDIGGE